MKNCRNVFAVLCVFCLVCVLQLVSVVSADSLDGWVKTYGGIDRYTSSESIIQTSDGGYAIAGMDEGFGALLLKTDSYGNMEWNQTYAGDGALSLIETPDTGYALTVGTRLIKTNQYGLVEWNRTLLGGTEAHSLIQTNDNEYVVAGYSGDYFWLSKTDEQGYNSWSKTFETVTAGRANSVIQTSDGGYALLGHSNFNPDFLLVKTDSLGELQWNKKYEKPDIDLGWSIVQEGDGGYMLAGMLWNRNETDNNAGLIKTDSNGNMLWMKNYHGGTPLSMIRTSDGGYILCSGATLVKTDSEGNMLWTKGLDLPNDVSVAQTHSVIQASDNGYAITGTGSPQSSDGQPTGISYAWIVKTDPEGIIPEFSSWTILPLVLVLGLAAFIIRNKISKNEVK